MDTEEILDKLADDHPECLKADGFDDAILGVVERAASETVICYDYDKCVRILVSKGMTEDAAHEWMSFNTMGAWVGEFTPVFLYNWRKESSDG
jgi:hypothetical protein